MLANAGKRGFGVWVLAGALLLPACVSGPTYNLSDATYADQICDDFDGGHLTEIVAAFRESWLGQYDIDFDEVRSLGEVGSTLAFNCFSNERIRRFEAEARKNYPSVAEEAIQDMWDGIAQVQQTTSEAYWFSSPWVDIATISCRDFYSYGLAYQFAQLNHSPYETLGDPYHNLWAIGIGIQMQCPEVSPDYWDQAAHLVADQATYNQLYADVFAYVDEVVQYGINHWLDDPSSMEHTLSVPNVPASALQLTTTTTRPRTTKTTNATTDGDQLSYPIPGSVYISLCDLYDYALLMEMVPEIQSWNWETPLSDVETLGLIGEAVDGWCPEAMDSYKIELENQYPELAEDVWFWIAAGAG